VASFRLNAGDARGETVEGAELYFAAAVISGEGRPGVGGRRQQCCLGIGAGEGIDQFGNYWSKA
jgi:hypothetical protein